jgi:hypothetical protein
VLGKALFATQSLYLVGMEKLDSQIRIPGNLRGRQELDALYPSLGFKLKQVLTLSSAITSDLFLTLLPNLSAEMG